MSKARGDLNCKCLCAQTAVLPNVTVWNQLTVAKSSSACLTKKAATLATESACARHRGTLPPRNVAPPGCVMPESTFLQESSSASFTKLSCVRAADCSLRHAPVELARTGDRNPAVPRKARPAPGSGFHVITFGAPRRTSCKPCESKKLLRTINVPTKYATNVGFGSGGADALYITGVFDQCKPPFPETVYRWTP